MGVKRSFMPDDIETMYANVDKNADSWWRPTDWAENNGVWLYLKLFPNAGILNSDFSNLDTYMQLILELNDVTKDKLDQILRDVESVERDYAKFFRNCSSDLSALGNDLKGLMDQLEEISPIKPPKDTPYTSDLTDKGIIALTIALIEIYGPGATIAGYLDTPENIAQARLDADEKGINLPLTKAQQEASETIYQKLKFEKEVAPLAAASLASAQAQHATLLTEVSSVAAASQLLIDIENHNRRNPDAPIQLPNFTPEQLAEIEAYRVEVEASKDPMYGCGFAVTSNFGWRDPPKDSEGNIIGTAFHDGIDLTAIDGNTRGAPIVSAWYGEVITASIGTNGGRGNYILIKLDTQVNGEVVCVLMQHMGGLSNIQAGDRVVPGGSLGTVGSSGGNYSPHLHLEIWVGEEKKPEDPRDSKFASIIKSYTNK